MLLISNEDTKQVLDMKIAMDAVWGAYNEFWKDEAVCRPRIDIRIPVSDPKRFYQFGTMEGGSTSGYFATRIKSDVIFEDVYGGTQTREWYNTRPGKFCGLVLLFSIENGELLAILNDGYLQHLRVGADSGIGSRAMSRENSEMLGIIGSGGMARAAVAAITLVRPIKLVQVYSPTKTNREQYAREIAAQYEIEVRPVDSMEAVFGGADIIAECSDAVIPTLHGLNLAPGMHIEKLGSGTMDSDTRGKIDRVLQFGRAPTPLDLPEWGAGEGGIVAYLARPGDTAERSSSGARGGRADRALHAFPEEKKVYYRELLSGAKAGRSNEMEITYSQRGNLQGLQFFPIAGKVYEAAKEKGLGREIPTDWFLQDIRN
jgi:alanine dehydrogenase